ncbi:hypothetical protein ElyMa_003838900 [Elysia marginata]|uniref:Uncharacterized protein n=1 Tax=Elysia marginata TaxID=1093978 RepID=A0AAV4FGL6_9GAST|nr:hypothetical protein ElyMa_003838900 [Elysia marginata]
MAFERFTTRKLPKVVKCIKKHSKSCRDEHARYDAKAVQDILEYMCTGAGRRLIHILSSSQCAEDLLSLEVAVLNCIDNFEMSIKTVDFTRNSSKQSFEPSDFCM